MLTYLRGARLVFALVLAHAPAFSMVRTVNRSGQPIVRPSGTLSKPLSLSRPGLLAPTDLRVTLAPPYGPAPSLAVTAQRTDVSAPRETRVTFETRLDGQRILAVPLIAVEREFVAGHGFGNAGRQVAGITDRELKGIRDASINIARAHDSWNGVFTRARRNGWGLSGIFRRFYSGQGRRSGDVVVPEIEFPRTARDASDSFQALFDLVRDKKAPPLPEGAFGFTYLVVPGFLWEDGKGYMEPNVDGLEALDLDARFVRTPPEGTIEQAAEAIRIAIAAADKPVMIIAHSKGGLDAIEAVSNGGDLNGRITDLATVQSPIFGTGIADGILWDTPIDGHPPQYLKIFGARYRRDPEAMRPGLLQISRRQRADTPDARMPIAPGVRLWSVGTRLPGTRTDGVVFDGHAVMPDSFYAFVDGADHMESVYGLRVVSDERTGRDSAYAADLTETTVRWILLERGNR